MATHSVEFDVDQHGLVMDYPGPGSAGSAEPGAQTAAEVVTDRRVVERDVDDSA